MSIKVQDLVQLMEQYAPTYMAEKWDNIGLLLGSFEQTVDKVMVSLDVTPDVVEQVIKENADMIIAHHPVIFSPLKNLAETNWQNKMLAKLLRHNIAVYCAHTNLDITKNGVNDILAKKIGLKNITDFSILGHEQLRKIVVFVPLDYADKVAQAMTQGGAGHIGKYSDCTFRTKGIGTFKPLEGTNPFSGEINKLANVSEIRLETVITKDKEEKVIQAMLKSHPYEEVAYDIYALLNEHNQWSLGRIGELKEELTVKDFAQLVKQSLNLEYVLYADAGKKVKKVAVCGGSGSDLIKIAQQKGADILVSADFKYHAAQEAIFSGLSIIDASHQGTELPIVNILQDYLTKYFADTKLIVLSAQEEMILQHV